MFWENIWVEFFIALIHHHKSVDDCLVAILRNAGNYDQTVTKGMEI